MDVDIDSKGPTNITVSIILLIPTNFQYCIHICNTTLWSCRKESMAFSQSHKARHSLNVGMWYLHYPGRDLTHSLVHLHHFKDKGGHSKSDNFLMTQIDSLATLHSTTVVNLRCTPCNRSHIMSPWAPWEGNSMGYFSEPFSSGQSEHHYLSWHLCLIVSWSSDISCSESDKKI